MKKLLNNIVGQEGGPHRVSKDFGWNSDLFSFRATVHHGIPGSPSCCAYDPLQKLLAIGTKSGFVKIFGKPGVEVVVNQYPNPVSLLQFVANFGRLAIIQGTFCELVNLNTKRSLGNINFGGDKVTTIYQLPCSPYVSFGMASGLVLFADSAKAVLSTYTVSHKHFQLEKPGPVTALQTHPTDSNILLISHAFGNLVEWNISKRQIVRKYSLGPSFSIKELGYAKTATWHSGGKKLIVGYHNGIMVVWLRNKPDSAYKRYLVSSDNNRRPIKKIYWTTFQSHQFLCVLGGTSITSDPNVVSLRYKKNLTLLPIIGSNYDTEFNDREVVDFALCVPSNLPFSSEPKGIITISSISTISVFKADELGRILYIPPPPSLQVQTSTITSTLFCSIPKSFMNDLMNTSDVSYNSQSWPIIGGFASLQPQNCSDILITGHNDGFIYFWDISCIQFNLLYAINVSNFSQSSTVSIQTVDLCVSSRILAVSCKNGETFIFFFRLTPSIISQAFNIKKSAVAVPQVTSRSALTDKFDAAQSNPPNNNVNNNNNPFSNNNNNNVYNSNSNPSISSVSDITPVDFSKIMTSIGTAPPLESVPEIEESKPSKTPRSGNSSNSSSSSSGSSSVKEAKFNWEQFFISASIDPASAKMYAKQFEDNKITEDLILELDNDMMEIAGVTIAGDKIRILKFIKTCKADPSILTSMKTREKKKRKKTSSSAVNSEERQRRHRDPNRPHRSKKDVSNSAEVPKSEPMLSTPPHIDDVQNISLPSGAITPPVINNNNNNNNSINNNNNFSNMMVGSSSAPTFASQQQQPQPQQQIVETKVDVILETPFSVNLDSYKEGTMPAGYQLKVQYSFKNQISRIRIASALSKLAVGDVKGNVALVDISTGSILLYKTLGGKNQTPVAWLCFDDRVIVEKSASSKTLEAGLYVGMEDGHIYYVALKTGQVENVPIEQLNSSNSSLSDIKLIDGNGSPVSPSAEEWKGAEDNSGNNNYGNANTDEAFVVKNLDEMKRKKEKAQKISGPLTNEDKKFMIVCFDHFISIYSLPSYQLYSTYECRTRPVAANIAQVHGNNCLVVFFASGDVEVLTLMDLSPITSIASALQKIGVQFNVYSIKDDVNCSLDGRFVVLSKFQEVIRGSLIVHENLLGLPHSIPSLFVPDVPLNDKEIEPFETFHAPGIRNYSQLFGKHLQTGVEKKSDVSKSLPTNTAPKPQKPKVMETAERTRKGVSSGLSDVKEVMQDNINIVNLRQERLEELLVSTNKLSQRSSGFADAAAALAAKEKSKKWWQ